MSLKAMYQQAGFSYLGNINHSQKFEKGKNFNVLTYSVYLASADASGYNVCPMANVYCKNACLNYAGYGSFNFTQKSRVNKTKLFFEDRDLFMNILVAEIQKYRKKAKKENMDFAVRFNATSDINLEQLKLNNQNILELFPDVMFYDYTKVFKYLKLANKYQNYDMTFSYSGTNWQECEKALQNNFRVAVIFENNIPDYFAGYPVINGDKYDMRYLDPYRCIVGLSVKKVPKEQLENFEQNPFFVPKNHKDREIV